MKDKVILITKEILRCDYLPVYGNRHWKTPHIDAIAERGTVFRKHFTNAPSTAMAVTCMFSGLEAHELERRYYTEVESFHQAPTVFDLFAERGYARHVLWTSGDHKATYPYSKCYGDGTVFHKVDRAPDDFVKEIETITDERFFLWIHLPTVMGDRDALGGDIDLFDGLVGDVEARFPDADFFISADHGHMNLEKGIPVYGFHVWDGAIHVPFITPRASGLAEVDFPTSHRQFKEILFQNKVSQPKFVYSDTQYYLQAQRKLAVILGRYKYIYNKYQRKEELYDREWDPSENVDLIPFIAGKCIVEPYRERVYALPSIYFYPNLKEAAAALDELRTERDAIWKEGSFLHEAPRHLKAALKNLAYTMKFRSRKGIVFVKKT